MNQKITTEWVPIFMEMADKLLQYRNNRKPLVEGIHHIIDNLNNWGIEITLAEEKFSDGSTGKLKDICPFTVFGIMNRGLTNKKRTAFLRQLAYFLKIPEGVGEFKFSGARNNDTDAIPFVHNVNYMFFSNDKSMKDADKKGDIDKLWNIFEIAINYADNKLGTTREDFIKGFDSIITGHAEDRKPGTTRVNSIEVCGIVIPVHEQGGVKQTKQVKLSEGLYWIRPYSYPTLSSKDGVEILNLCLERAGFGDVSFDNISGDEYLRIRDGLKIYFNSDDSQINDFIELSFASYHNLYPIP